MQQTKLIALATAASASSLAGYNLDAYYGSFGNGFAYDDFQPTYRHEHPAHVIPTPVYDPYVSDVAYPKPYQEAQKHPSGDYERRVRDFNEWEEVFTQQDYEARVNEEAEMMIALEALREAMVDLDYFIDHLEDDIRRNTRDIRDNIDEIRYNDKNIQANGEYIEFQQYRARRLQKECRYVQRELDQDRALLELHCQQFAFANDMVGACADILSCAGTERSYEWEQWHPVAYPAGPQYQHYH